MKIILFLLSVTIGMAQQERAFGIFEACIGTDSADELIEFYELFGYRLGSSGELNESLSKKLYNTDSKLKSFRLYHQNSDHGLIRIMEWDKPISDGLGISDFKFKGSRWTAALTNNIMNISNHALVSERQGQEVKYIEPQWSIIYQTKDGLNPFKDPLVGVREMLYFRPLTRHIFYQRFNYKIPRYGNVNLDSHFETSQVTHFGLVIQDDSKKTMDFYEKGLGLMLVRDGSSSPVVYDPKSASSIIWGLEPGEMNDHRDYDDYRSSKEFMKARSGRLKIIRFPEATKIKNMLDVSRPGHKGLTLYTYQTKDIDALRKRVRKNGAKKITKIHENEFGERSFSFDAPDGYAWNIIEYKDLKEGYSVETNIESLADLAFERFKNGLKGGSWGPFFEMLDDDFTFHFPQGDYLGLNEGKDKAIEFFNYVGTVYPDGLEITELLRRTVSGNTAVFEFKDEGRMSIRGKDLPYKNRVTISLDFENGKIKHYREYFGSDGKSN